MCSTAPRSPDTRASEIEEEFVPRQRRGLGKAPVEVARIRIEGEEAEIGEVGVELGLGMAGQEPLADARFVGAGGAAGHGQARMGQRIALAADGEQQRAARVLVEVARMRREPRHQHQGRAVVVGRDGDERGEGRAVLGVERGEGARPHAAQQLPGQPDGVERRLRRGKGLGRAAPLGGRGRRVVVHEKLPPGRPDPSAPGSDPSIARRARAARGRGASGGCGILPEKAVPAITNAPVRHGQA
jgi:hypothetical protein